MLDQSDDYAEDMAQALESAADDLAYLYDRYGLEAIAAHTANFQLLVSGEYDVEIELVADKNSMN